MTKREALERIDHVEFLGWVEYFGLRGETVEERGARVWGALATWANTHNATLRK